MTAREEEQLARTRVRALAKGRRVAARNRERRRAREERRRERERAKALARAERSIPELERRYWKARRKAAGFQGEAWSAAEERASRQMLAAQASLIGALTTLRRMRAER